MEKLHLAMHSILYINALLVCFDFRGICAVFHFLHYFRNMEVGARQMTQLVNVLAAKHKNQSSIPRIHMLKRENQLTQTVF